MVIRNSTDTSLSIIAIDYQVTNCSRVPLHGVRGCQMYTVYPGGVRVCGCAQWWERSSPPHWRNKRHSLESPSGVGLRKPLIGVLWLFKMASIFTLPSCYVLVTSSMLLTKHCHQLCSARSLLLSMFYWRVYCAYKHCRQKRREHQLISKWICSMNYKTDGSSEHIRAR